LTLPNITENPFLSPTLNPFISLGKAARITVREQIQSLFAKDSPKKDDILKTNNLLFPLKDVQMLLPCQVGDYTDFYSSRNHAENVGTMFRGKENALQPNWLWMPIGYHGRASSIRVSPTSFKRPSG
jgi:fumarylacetoacetase